MAGMDDGPSDKSNRHSSSSNGSNQHRPISSAFPGRPISRTSSPHPSLNPPTSSTGHLSRSSSNSQLSNRSPSALSIHSIASAHGSITPSVSAGEWSRVSHPPDDDIPDYSPRTPIVNRDSTWSSLSTSSSPFPVRSPARSPNFPSSQSNPSSPNRLQPRSARNERLPMEDLAFFRDAMDSGPSSPSEGDSATRWTGDLLRTRTKSGGSAAAGGGGRTMLDDDRRSLISRSSQGSSLRSLRLRHEIEQTANQLRASSSYEGLGIAGAGPSSGSDVESRPRLNSNHSRGSTGNGVAGPPIPSPQDDSETRSIASAKSTASMPSLFGGAIWSNTSSPGGSQSGLAPPMGGSGRESRDRDRDIIRPRQRELKEWSQTCWIWQREKASFGMLSKTPLMREVPAAMKRKMGKRDSSQLLSADINLDDSKGKSGKASFGVGPSSSTKEGSWRKVTGVMRDDGYFRVFSEDTVILHSIHLPSVLRTDVRLVDPSLFGRPNCLVIHRRQASPQTPGLQTKPSRTSSSSSSPLNGSRTSSDDPLYICMPSIVTCQSWLVMAHCFARPEFYSGAKSSLQDALENDPNLDGSDGDDSDPGEEVPDQRCRIFRSITISINEGRGIGEQGTEIVRPASKSSLERRPDVGREGSGSSASIESFPLSTTSGGGGVSDNPSPSRANAPPAMRLHRGDNSRDNGDSSQGMDTFCEISMDGDALARTSIRKGTTSPFWNECFTFSDLPPITQPLTIRVFQSHKSSRPTLVGLSIIRVPDHPRAEPVEDWWPVKPLSYDTRSRSTDTVGELSLTVKVDEEVVLPSSEYAPILELLTDDVDAALTTGIAHEFPADLEEVAKILLRIYQAESQLLPRILRLAEQEIDGDIKSAAILFRGNSILTKSVELYLRLVGAEYLELSIGETVRKICADKVEIEIDPSRMKSGVKEKDIQNNVNHLREWTTEVWNRMYSAREKCPNEVRMIFAHIQRIVFAKYGEEHYKMRSTSVSAFIFLRFFVPAVLNPKLFSLVPHPPDSKAQRSLTLIAKTLQGLANFSTFGQKEPWMFPMNGFVQDHTSAFVDFIDNISTPSPTARFEWTSPSSASYLAPYRLRNSLSPAIREGVPLLPHLIDLPRDLGLLASHMARAACDRGGPASSDGRADDASRASSRASRSSRLGEFSDRCVDVHEEAQRRGGGLVAAVKIRTTHNNGDSGSTRLRPRAATARGGSGWSGFSASSHDVVVPPQTPPPKRQQSVEEIHIRAVPPITTTSLPASPRGSLASRRSHRSFTISPGDDNPRSSISGLSAEDFLTLEERGVGDGGEEKAGPLKLDFGDAIEPTKVSVGETTPLDYAFPSSTKPRSRTSSKNHRTKEEEQEPLPTSPTPSRPSSTNRPLEDGAPAAAAAATTPTSFFNNPFSSASPPLPMPTSIRMSNQSSRTSKGSDSSQQSGAGRRPSTAGAILQSFSFGGDDPFGGSGDGGGRKKGIFRRKNSRATPTGTPTLQ
ncbi:hypothetical protein P7C70_g3933, partial [Phenoliferia sp. Uapishka_3]